MRRPLMSIVGGLDMHRKQITFDYLDTMTGALCRGKIMPADRLTLREWLGRFADYRGSVRLVVEGCTGWRYVVEECRRAGIDIHVAEPADTASARGPKRHAKTDKLDAKHLRELLVQGRIPESWIPPEQVLEVRAKVRLYKDLRDERTDWIQRTRRAHRLDPADPRHALPPGRARAARGRAGSWQPGRLGGRCGTVPGRCPGGDRRGAADRPAGYRDRRPARRDPLVRRDPARLQGVAAPVRDRQAHRRDHLGRAWRHAPVLRLPPRRPAHRPGHLGVLLRRQTHPRPPRPPGSAAAALGAV